jgi:formiminotetrahydrofolate cyclodeaminase
MEIKDQSLQVFLDTLASKSATPGGGSAAAVMGAQAAALTSMVCNLTLGKAKYAAVEIQMLDLLKQSETLRQQLIEMIKADIDVFNQVMASYALPKQTDTEIAQRTEAIQIALTAATEVPLACARLCRQAIELSRIACDQGNTAVVSDAGVAVMAAYAGLKSAALNVYVNANSLKDQVFAQAKLAELAEILADADSMMHSIYQDVQAKL